MSSQSILATATPANGVLDATLAESFVVIDVRNYVGWGFDININSEDATGEIAISSQYTNYLSTVEESDPDVVAEVTTGVLFDGSKKLIVDSNNALTRGFLKVKWKQLAASTGTLNIVGIGTLRG